MAKRGSKSQPHHDGAAFNLRLSYGNYQAEKQKKSVRLMHLPGARSGEERILDSAIFLGSLAAWHFRFYSQLPGWISRRSSGLGRRRRRRLLIDFNYAIAMSPPLSSSLSLFFIVCLASSRPSCCHMFLCFFSARPGC